MTHEEKAQEIVEFYIGDCACEQDHPCDSCRMVHDIEKALVSAEKKGREDRYDEVILAQIRKDEWNEAIEAAVKASLEYSDSPVTSGVAESINKLKRG